MEDDATVDEDNVLEKDEVVQEDEAGGEAARLDDVPVEELAMVTEGELLDEVA